MSCVSSTAIAAYSKRRCDRNWALGPSQPISVTGREIDPPASEFLSRQRNQHTVFFLRRVACGHGESPPKLLSVKFTLAKRTLRGLQDGGDGASFYFMWVSRFIYIFYNVKSRFILHIFYSVKCQLTILFYGKFTVK